MLRLVFGNDRSKSISATVFCSLHITLCARQTFIETSVTELRKGAPACGDIERAIAVVRRPAATRGGLYRHRAARQTRDLLGNFAKRMHFAARYVELAAAFAIEHAHYKLGKVVYKDVV